MLPPILLFLFFFFFMLMTCNCRPISVPFCHIHTSSMYKRTVSFFLIKRLYNSIWCHLNTILNIARSTFHKGWWVRDSRIPRAGSCLAWSTWAGPEPGLGAAYWTLIRLKSTSPCLGFLKPGSREPGSHQMPLYPLINYSMIYEG